MAYRMFLFDETGAMHRIPHRIANRLPAGGAKLPEYAGKRLRYAVVWLITRNRLPLAVDRIEAAYLDFDEEGGAQRGLALGAMEALETGISAKEERQQRGPVVSATARIARRHWEEKHRWRPSETEKEMMRAAIWPRRQQGSR